MAVENAAVQNNPSARRFLIALSVALLLHAVLVVGLLFLSRPKPAQRKASPPLVFELREKRTPPPKPADPAAAPKLPAAPARTAASPKKAAPAAPGTGAKLPALPKASETGPATASAEPGAATSSGKGWVPGMQLSLELQPGALGKDGEGPPQLGGLVTELTPEEKRADEKNVVEGRIHTWVRDISARQRAESRDVYWQGLQEKLAVGPKVEWDVLDKGPHSGGGGARVIGEAAKQWQQAASAYGRGGNPFAAGGPGTRDSLGSEANHLAPEDRGFRGDASLGNSLGTPLALGAGNGDGPFSHRLIVFLMITQSEDGAILDVRVQGGSGNRFYDDFALTRARTLGKLSLGIPPKGHAQSLWAFETDFTQIPPLPIFGCALDNFIPKDCYYPLKKSVNSRWRLEAVY